MQRQDVALLAGGDASEHEISLRSGQTLAQALADAGFGVHGVLIARDGTWNLMPRDAPFSRCRGIPQDVASALPEARVSGSPLEVAGALLSKGVRVSVLGLHGRGGEDGSIQGFLETAGFAFTGAGVGASALAVDKLHFKRLLVGEGLPTPPFREILREEPLRKAVAATCRDLGEELVVKAPALGSSVDVYMTNGPAEAARAVSAVLARERRALVETRIRGAEVTCPVIGPAGAPRALPLIAIRPSKAAWFDYRSKYSDGGAEEIVPAPLEVELTRYLQQLACRVHSLVGARGVTRTDVMLDGAGRPFILETNTLPGMTSASLVPKAAAAAGIPLPELARLLVDDALAARAFPAPQTAAAEA